MANVLGPGMSASRPGTGEFDTETKLRCGVFDVHQTHRDRQLCSQQETYFWGKPLR